MSEWIKSNWKSIALAVSVIVASAAIGVLLGERSSYRHNYERHTAQSEPTTRTLLATRREDGSYQIQYEAENKEPEHWLWLRSAEDALAWLTFFLVVGTVLLAIFTAGLWKDTRDIGRSTLDNLTDSHARELRAYVSIVAVTLLLQRRGDKWHATANIKISNFGKTPAYDVRPFGHFKLVPWEFAEQLPEVGHSDAFASKAALGPSAERTRHDTIDDFDLSSIVNGTREKPARFALIAYGKFTYRDAFGVDRTTHYKSYLGGIEGLGIGFDLGNGAFEHRMHTFWSGNDSD